MNRIDKVIGEAGAAVERRTKQYEAEADYARAEKGELGAADKAFMNSWIDEMREQDALADADYADRMLERMREDVDDH